MTSRVPAEGRNPEPVDAKTARQLTTELRQAMRQAHQALAHLADRVHAAHQSRVWIALGYPGWGAYAEAELQMSRAQAYRLLDIATTLRALTDTAKAAGALSPMGDTSAVQLWDFGLSQRALRDVAAHTDELAEELHRALADTAPEQLADPEAVRALVQHVVAAARHPQPTLDPVPKPDDDVPDNIALGRALVEQAAASAASIGQLALEIAPAYLSDDQATEQSLHLLAEAIGCGLDELLAARRYAMTGDRRALDGTVL